LRNTAQMSLYPEARMNLALPRAEPPNTERLAGHR